jgi:hypothetical protein
MADEYIWFKNGKESKRTADEEGKLISSEKLSNGGDVTYYYVRGEVRFKEYRKDGDEPAYISYLSTGTLKLEEYWKNGKQHREGDKPAYIYYFKNGGREESYYKDGYVHRKGKPAYIDYGPDGSVREEIYYNTGLRVDKHARW